ncbi:hypothetical protein [Streptomyces antarcticus]|uniref:hypothetical protein n=1 Tax=Streptomyces antarcticus TaxID=2996458 RepID=UPI0022AE805D|nr:hypothetical protein [Streptomyces sp. H34-S5]MCZ4087898.1 hypothetical protein [Streptomyces sp. H34-S5]
MVGLLFAATGGLPPASRRRPGPQAATGRGTLITCHAVEWPGTGIPIRRDEDRRIVGACSEGDGEDQDGVNAATDSGGLPRVTLVPVPDPRMTDVIAWILEQTPVRRIV